MAYLFTAFPFVLVLLVAFAAVAGLGFSMARPAPAVYVLIAVLVAFTGSNYGQLDVERTVYSRGTGQLYFSLVNYYLWGIGIVIALRNAFSRVSPGSSPLAKYFLAFALLILANAVVAGGSPDRSLRVFDAFSYSGLLNVLNMGVFFYVCANTFGVTKEIRPLLTILFFAIGARGVFGLVRFAFFGGDSANVYDNVERTGTRLTFFDVSDSYLATMAAFCAAWLLSFRKQVLSGRQQYALWALLILEIAIVVLSFRRSSLVSMGLASAFFITLLPTRKRFMAVLVASGLVVGSYALIIAFRLSRVRGADPSRGFLFDIFGGDKGVSQGSRTLEYTETWRSLGDNWLFGKGMWGVLQSNLAELSYHAGNFGFVHSGFGHVLLKSGLFGLTMFIGIFLSFSLYYFKVRNALNGEHRMLADLGAAGVLFWLPSLLLGTPIIEFRSMLMLGFALALPFIGVRAAADQRVHVAT